MKHCRAFLQKKSRIPPAASYTYIYTSLRNLPAFTCRAEIFIKNLADTRFFMRH